LIKHKTFLVLYRHDVLDVRDSYTHLKVQAFEAQRVTMMIRQEHMDVVECFDGEQVLLNYSWSVKNDRSEGAVQVNPC
jgi:hypothetical protein